MSKVFHIGLNDLRVFLRDRSALIWLLGMPIAFAYFMGFATRGGGNDPKNARPEIVIVNHDSGYMSQLFLETLGKEGLNPVSKEQSDEAKRGLEIPKDFTEKILSKEQSAFSFFKVGKGDDQQAFLGQVVLARSIVAFNSYLLEAAGSGDKIGEVSEAKIREAMAAENPIGLDARFAGRKPIPVGYNLSLPGNLVMYLMVNLMIFGGSSVAAERRSGVLRRMSISPLSKSELLGGKLLGLILLGCVQIGVLIMLGQFVFGLNIGDNLFGILLTLLMLSWVAASMGLMIGFLIRSEEKVVGLSLMIALPMAALGGCWWPIEIVSESLQAIAQFIPTGVALKALHQLITFGGDLSSVWEQLGILSLFGLVTNIAAVKCFRV